jgi:hypothetical protein
MESIQAYTDRMIAKFDTNRNGVIELNPTIFSNHVEAGGPNNNMRNRQFFEMARNPILPFVADQVSISRAVQMTIDTNHDNQISFFEKVKAWTKFRLW